MPRSVHHLRGRSAERAHVRQALEEEGVATQLSHPVPVHALDITPELRRAAIEQGFALCQAHRGGRDVPVQKSGDVELKPVTIVDAGGRTMQEAKQAWRGFKDDIVEMATGEKVVF